MSPFRVAVACCSILIYFACAALAARDWWFERPTHVIPALATAAFAVVAARVAWRWAGAGKRADRAE